MAISQGKDKQYQEVKEGEMENCKWCGSNVNVDPKFKICEKCIERKFNEVKHQRIASLKKDMRA